MATKRKTAKKKTANSGKQIATANQAPPPAANTLPAEVAGLNAMIEQVVNNPNLPVEKLNALLDMQLKVMDRQAEIDLNAAMSKFRSIATSIKHNRQGEGPGGSIFSYADYPQVVDTINPWLADCELSFTHKEDPPVIDGGKIVMINITCTVKHRSGAKVEASVPAIPDYKLEAKQDRNQLVQRARTYAKRQSLAEALGLSTKEDKNDADANGPIPPQPVSQEQAANIHALLDEVAPEGPKRAAREKKLLTWIRVDSVEEIPASDYERVVKALEAARAKVAEA